MLPKYSVCEIPNFGEVHYLLLVLSTFLTSKTEIRKIPVGHGKWKLVKMTEDDDSVVLYEKTVDLILFFGLYVGYCAEMDILVFWNPNEFNS